MKKRTSKDKEFTPRKFKVTLIYFGGKREQIECDSYQLNKDEGVLTTFREHKMYSKGSEFTAFTQERHFPLARVLSVKVTFDPKEVDPDDV